MFNLSGRDVQVTHASIVGVLLPMPSAWSSASRLSRHRGICPLRFSDYGKLTVICALVAYGAWPIVTRSEATRAMNTSVCFNCGNTNRMVFRSRLH
jgi:hypothetical protein